MSTEIHTYLHTASNQLSHCLCVTLQYTYISYTLGVSTARLQTGQQRYRTRSTRWQSVGKKLLQYAANLLQIFAQQLQLLRTWETLDVRAETKFGSDLSSNNFLYPLFLAAQVREWERGRQSSLAEGKPCWELPRQIFCYKICICTSWAYQVYSCIHTYACIF